MKFKQLILAAGVLLAPVVQAYECYEASPNFVALGEAYYSSADRLEVTGEEAGLAVLKRLQGDWRGELTEVLCEGSESEPEKVVKQGEVTLELRPSQSALLMAEINKDYDDGYQKGGEELFLLSKNSLFALRATDRHIEATERERRGWSGNHGGSRYVEVFSQIDINGEKLRVNWQLFSNGVFVFSQTLDLRRD